MKSTDTTTVRPLHIVHIIYNFEVGGAETMLVDIINRQIELGHKVDFVVVNRGIDADLRSRLNPAVNLISMDRAPGSAPLWMMLRLNLLLARLHPDIIHAHHHKFGRLVRLFRDHLLVTVHAINKPMVYCGTSAMVAITDTVANDIRARVPNANVRTITNGIRTADVIVRDDRAPGERLKIVQVARLDTATKGQDILIRALAQLRRSEGDIAEVTFIGTGKDEERLRQLADEMGVADRVTFAGLRDRHYIYTNLHNFDAMVHPSRSEGFGLTIAEAMAARLPLIVTEHDGPWEVADHGRLCDSVPVDNPEALAAAISRLRAGYASLKARTDQALQYVERFDIARTVDSYIDYYRTLAKK